MVEAHVSKSPRDLRLQLIVLLPATVVGFVLGYVVALAPQGGTRSDETRPSQETIHMSVSPTPTDAETTSVALQLEELRQGLLAVTAGSRTPALEVTSTPETEQRLELILAGIARVEAKLARAGSMVVPSVESLNRDAPKKLAEIRRLADGVQVNREQMEREVHLMTTREAIDRFGFPDRSGPCGNNNGTTYEMFLCYEHVNSRGERYTALELLFINDRVVAFQAHWKD